MTDDDPDSLTRADIDELAAKLDLLPDLEREMAIALTGTTRPGGPGVRHLGAVVARTSSARWG